MSKQTNNPNKTINNSNQEKTEVKLLTGDCVQEMAKLEDNSIDAIVTDPPYGLKFMGKEFDDLGEGAKQKEWHKAWAVEALRVLKPGGHLLAFGGTRTYHHLATAVEEAGFEIRDQIQWLYGSGFPKSLNVGKAIDKRGGSTANFEEFRDAVIEALDSKGLKRKDLQEALDNYMLDHYLTKRSQPAIPNYRDYQIIRDFVGLGDRFDPMFKEEAEREVVGTKRRTAGDPSVPIAACVGNKNDGWFDITAPATEEAARWEGWGTALKPANEPCVLARKPFRGTVAENVQEWGTGAMNIEEARIGGKEGRWPANVILDEEAGELLDEQSGSSKSSKPSKQVTYGEHKDTSGNKILGKGLSSATPNQPPYGDQGGASRFFYCPKAAKKERNAGLDAFEKKKSDIRSDKAAGILKDMNAPQQNNHPTVKPVKLMAYLIRLVTPPGGTVLDPFLGSGSTGLAAIEEENSAGFIGIEKDPEYMKIAKARIEHWQKEETSSDEK